jgi:hypothetical protein
MKFPTFTAAQKIKLASLALLFANTVLVYGDKVSAVPGLPGWVAHLWPFVFALAGIVHQSASIFGVTAPPVYQLSQPK